MQKINISRICLTAVNCSLLAFFTLVIPICPGQGEKLIIAPCAYASDKPQFIKEGELTFLEKKNKKRITKIDIEIADNAYEREKGLMHRHNLPDNAGMLFVFERPEPRSFWMRNTYISLDIIFADGKKQIISIHRKAKPLSYAPIASKKKTKYAVEVNEGFCDRNGISIGDFIEFERGL